jgi:hypothetical protein
MAAHIVTGTQITIANIHKNKKISSTKVRALSFILVTETQAMVASIHKVCEI